MGFFLCRRSKGLRGSEVGDFRVKGKNWRWDQGDKSDSFIQSKLFFLYVCVGGSGEEGSYNPVLDLFPLLVFEGKK